MLKSTCCCSGAGPTSSCLDICPNCSILNKQINIQVGMNPTVCSYQSANQARTVPVGCSALVFGGVFPSDFATFYPMERTGCQWGTTYAISRITSDAYLCTGCGAVASGCEDEGCCSSDPNTGPCFTLSACVPACDCDDQCCRSLTGQQPGQPAYDACMAACFAQKVQRYCSQVWNTDTIGQGTYKEKVLRPSNLEYRFSAQRNLNSGGLKEYGDITFRTGGNQFPSGDPFVTPGFTTYEDGSCLKYGDYSSPTGAVCDGWSVSGNCFTGVFNPVTGVEIPQYWYGYRKKIGRNYAVVNGRFKVEASRSVLSAPTNGSGSCWSSQVDPVERWHTAPFLILYEGTPASGYMQFNMVNSVAGFDSFTAPGNGRPDLSCKCEGYIPGADQLVWQRIGMVYGSGFQV